MPLRRGRPLFTLVVERVSAWRSYHVLAPLASCRPGLGCSFCGVPFGAHVLCQASLRAIRFALGFVPLFRPVPSTPLTLSSILCG